MILIEGWIKQNRSILNHWVFSDREALQIWMYFRLKAAFEPKRVYELGRLIDLLPGQIIFRGPQLADLLGIDKNKIYKTIKLFEDDGMITVKSNGKRYSIITLKSCDIYEGEDMPFEIKRETNEKPKHMENSGFEGLAVHQKENLKRNKKETIYKNDKNSKNKEIDIHSAIFEEIISYLNKKADTQYRHTSKVTQQHISARLNEGYTIDDFKKVIDNKVVEWGHEPANGEKDMRNYLRPETLFGTKFDSYLNSKPVRRQLSRRDNFIEREYDDAFFKMLENASIKGGK